MPAAAGCCVGLTTGFDDGCLVVVVVDGWDLEISGGFEAELLLVLGAVVLLLFSGGSFVDDVVVVLVGTGVDGRDDEDFDKDSSFSFLYF